MSLTSRQWYVCNVSGGGGRRGELKVGEGGRNLGGCYGFWSGGKTAGTRP